MTTIPRAQPWATLMLAVAALAACSGPDEPTFGGNGGGGDGGTTSGTDCPTGTTAIEQASVTLGETDSSILSDHPGTVVEADAYDIDAYCIGTLPLPGSSGQPWPSDGLSLDQLEDIEALLATGGRRLCTLPELMLAAAGLDNWRYPYSASTWDGTVCEDDDFNPRSLGSNPGCVSPLGVSDFQVRSSWARLDELTRDNLAPHYKSGFDGDGVYASWGGTARDDTYYAPSNYGVHFHGSGEDAYVDDGLRVCADPGGVDSDQASEWTALVQQLVSTGTFAGWLSGGTTGASDTGDTGG